MFAYCFRLIVFIAVFHACAAHCSSWLCKHLDMMIIGLLRLHHSTQVHPQVHNFRSWLRRRHRAIVLWRPANHREIFARWTQRRAVCILSIHPLCCSNPYLGGDVESVKFQQLTLDRSTYHALAASLTSVSGEQWLRRCCGTYHLYDNWLTVVVWWYSGQRCKYDILSTSIRIKEVHKVECLLAHLLFMCSSCRMRTCVVEFKISFLVCSILVSSKKDNLKILPMLDVITRLM